MIKRISFCGFCAFLWLTFVPVAAQTPPRKDLVTLQWPDLARLEPSVREQVTELQDELVKAAKDPGTSATALGEAYGNLAQIYHAYSLNAAAHDAYLNASLLAPADFRWIYLLAKLDQQDGRFDDAIRRFQAARKLKPDYVATLVNLGNIFLELNRLDEASESFTAALAIEKTNPAAHYGLGQIAMSKRNYAEAVDHFEETLAQVPGADRVHYSLAMAYRGLGNTEKVKTHLAKQGPVGVGVVDPLVAGLQDLIAGERLHLARGKQAFEARRYAEAVAQFRKAVAANPRSVTARINLGAALTQAGDASGASEQFQEALRIEPGKVNAHYNLAILLAAQNKPQEAINHLQSALKTDPDDVLVRYLLAQQLVKAGRENDALPEFARVVPDNEAALLEYAKLLHRRKEFRPALDILETGRTRYPQRGRTLVLLAYLLATSPAVELRDGTRALELSQQIYSATGAAQHGALVALALAELGRCGEARDWQQRMIAESKSDVLVKLQANLKHYESQPCRPPSDTSLEGFSLYER